MDWKRLREWKGLPDDPEGGVPSQVAKSLAKLKDMQDEDRNDKLVQNILADKRWDAE